jgi:hypothetical protein
MLRRLALVRTNFSEEPMASIIKVKGISEVIAYDIPSSPILFTVMIYVSHYSEISFVRRGTRRNITGDVIPHSYRHENLKTYIALIGWAL